MFRLIKPILFKFSPETAHKIIIRLLIFLRYIPFSGRILRLFYTYKRDNLAREVFGIKFPNPIGLAAGFDKNGDMYNDLANFGFGFIEIGSLTPNAQKGNPKPRCFRLEDDSAIINRMGINNKGVKYAIKSIEGYKPRVIIGGNIGKSTTCVNEMAHLDYEKSFSQLYDYVDYFVLNVSCPNVKGLAKLQDIASLSEIIDKLLALRRCYDDYKPILLKVSPDLTYDQLDEIIDLIQASNLDGIVATNTTTARSNLKSSQTLIDSIGDGGLSGAPLYGRSLEVIKHISRKTNGKLPIVAVGGIMSPAQAKEMLDAGASLVEIYTGFIYNGPGFVRKTLRHISKSLSR